MRRKLRFLLFFLQALFLLSSCAVPVMEEEPLVLPTGTSTDTPTVTMTIQWFPATSTPTPRPTRTLQSTLDLRPGVVSVLLEDDFNDPAVWALSQSQEGNVALANQRLSLAVSSPGGSLSSLREAPILEDFYIEISASPNLCRELDSYGLILRAGEEAQYRYAVSCGGMLRFEEVSGRRVNVLQEWTPSGQVPMGAPSRLRLGVWAYGDEMRFFVGDTYQFSVQRLAHLQGQIGVFARSEGATAVTVSFSDLLIYSLGRVPPTLAPSGTSTLSSDTPTP